MFAFITRKPFWVNFLAAIGLGLLIIFFLLQLLGWMTKHGEYLTVPKVKGKGTAEAIRLLESQGFEVVIQDSVYTDSLARGTVIKQLPEPNSTVKINRAVFITVNRYVPPMIAMPSLEGKSMNFAIDILRRSHLQLQDTLFRPDFMKGSVIEQQFQGVRISAGTKLQWGSAVTLVIGGGLQDENIPVPELLGLTYGQAKSQLDSMGITLSPVPDLSVRDTLAAFVYRQNPMRLNDEKQLNYIRPGMVMDLWLSREMIYLTDTTTQSIKTNAGQNNKSKGIKPKD
jgi:beta-lactam-binding protein with PASTA domain